MAVPLGPKEPPRGDYWRGDLLRAMLFFEQNSGDFVSFASQRGYEYHPRISVDLGPTDYDGQGCETEVIEPELSITPAEVRNIIHEFWVPVFYPYSLSQNKNGSRKLDATSDTSVSLICDSHVRLPEVKYIASWPELRNRLEPFLSLARPSRRVDTQMLVRRISRGDAIRKVPFLHRKRVKDHITLVKDMSLRCVPYRLDQEMIAQRLSTLAIRGGLKVLNGASPFGLTSPTRAVKSSLSSRSSRNRKSRYIDPEPGSDVLILGDLGVLLKTGIQSAGTLTNGIPTSNWQGDGEDVQDWYHACRRWSLLGCRIFALVPYSTMLIAPSFRHWVHPIAWQGNAFDGISGQEQVANLEMLLTIASPAQRVEPGLLREFRRLSPGIGDASIEAVYWQDSRHLGPRLDAIKQPRNSSRQGFLKRFEKLDPKLIHQTLLWMRRYRLTSGANVLWQTELMNLPVHLRALIDPNHEDQKIAIRTYQAFDWQRQEGGPHGISDRLTSIAMDASEHAIEDLDIGPTVQRIRMEYMPGEASSSLTRLDGVRAGEKAFRVQIRGRAEGLEVSSKAFGQVEPKGLFSSRTNTEVCLSTDKGLIEIKGLGGVRQGLSEQVFWKSGRKPEWVSDYGTDQYGAWCEFQVPRHDGKGMVTQRMRWIKPGDFMMGSPEGEKERFADEVPQHRVILSHGYWMADSQVTQELWMAMRGGENPSRFKGERNPVEGVSWEDCQAWISKLGLHHESLKISLPTEAQWEYACRAGSTTAYCFGDDSKELINYGWFKENAEQTTIPVNQLQPNNWGLYDMHGNVWEWCSDWYGEYEKSASFDPTGPAKGTYRVMRGGGWVDPSRLLRSHCRFGLGSGYRNDTLGFRIAGSGQGAEPSERAMLPVAEQGTERVRIGTADLEYRFVCSIGLGAKDAIQLEREFSHIKVDAYSSIRIATEQEEYQFDRLTKPTWAVDFGADDYGLYATLEITLERVNKESKGIARWFRRKQSELDSVRQRMRWIPPGRFMMGSPDGKDYGISGQYPQHEVIITHGYWMFETPCTQGLWSALMGKNPSYFSDDDRPVESVRWEEAVDFAAKLNERMSESYPTDGRSLVAGWDRLMFRLPTEAEWEYACRAGTTSDTYAGDLELESNDAAKSGILDSIAWYGGNSGHMYDLETGVEMTWLRDLRDEENMGGTRKVGKKHPNPWGLYDMLGNVWEWCQDWYGEYSVERLVDPFGPSQGTTRVVRGGSWDYPARYLRSACRLRNAPGLRYSDLGFRLLSSAHQADQATESGN